MTRNPTPSEQAGREVSLAEFLLARIAEDEGKARSLLRRAQEHEFP